MAGHLGGGCAGFRSIEFHTAIKVILERCDENQKPDARLRDRRDDCVRRDVQSCLTIELVIGRAGRGAELLDSGDD